MRLAFLLCLLPMLCFGQQQQSFFLNRRAVASNYTIKITDTYLSVTANCTNTLPPANTCRSGQTFFVKANVGITATVRPSGSDTIESLAVDDIVYGELLGIYVCNGVNNWEHPPAAQSESQVYPNIAAMIAARPSAYYTNVFVLGYRTANDGGGGQFTWRSLDTTLTNMGTAFQTTFAGYSGRYLRQMPQLGWLNVLWFGVQGDNTSGTAGAQNALNTLDPSMGGMVYHPPGTYRENLVLTNKNQALWYDSWIKEDAGIITITNRVIADNISQPIVTIGNGIQTAKGCRIFGGLFTSTSGDGVLLRLAGGAYECEINGTQFYNGRTNIWIQATGNQPCSVNQFFGGSCQAANVDNSRGLYISAPDAGSGVTVGNYFSGYHFNSHAPGLNTFTAEFDAADAVMTNVRFDLLTGCPILFSSSSGVNPQTAIIYAANVIIDGNSSNPAIVENFGAAQRVSAVLQGNYTFNGQMQVLSGQVIPQELCLSPVVPGGNLFGPVVRGPMQFQIGAGAFTNDTSMTIENNNGNELLVQATNTPVRLESSTNVIVSIMQTNHVTVTSNSVSVLGMLHVTNFGDPINYSDGPQTNAMRVSEVVTTNNVVDVIHVDVYSHAFTNYEGAAMSFGLRDDVSGDLTSRLVFFGDVNHSRYTRLGWQTHTDTSGLWNSGMWMDEFGAMAIGQTNLPVNSSVLLDLTSTTRGFRPPYMTSAQRLAIGSPVDGLIVYQIDGLTNLYMRLAGGWAQLLAGPVATGSALRLDSNSRVQPISFGAGFTWDGTTLNIATNSSGSASNAYAVIMIDGTPLTVRTNVNFVGPALSGVDNAGANRSDITMDSDINALAANTGNGLWARTGAGTGAARSISGAGLATVANGDGVAGPPVITVLANPTDNFLPYRVSATSFGDSPLKRESVSQVSDSYRAADQFGPTFVLLKQGRTGSTTNTPSSGAQLGILGAGGWNGTADVYGQTFRWLTTESWTGAANGQKLELWTVANGGSTQARAFTFDQNGQSIPFVSAAPSTTTAGGFAFDNNIFGASRGAMQIFDGTENTIAVSTKTFDTPATGDVPMFDGTGWTNAPATSLGGGGGYDGFYRTKVLSNNVETDFVTFTLPTNLTGGSAYIEGDISATSAIGICVKTFSMAAAMGRSDLAGGVTANTEVATAGGGQSPGEISCFGGFSDIIISAPTGTYGGATNTTITIQANATGAVVTSLVAHFKIRVQGPITTTFP